MAQTPNAPDHAVQKMDFVALARQAKHRGLIARRDLGSAAKSIRLSWEPSRRQIRRRVARGLELPELPHLPTPHRQAIWAVSMVRNEEDNIEGVVRHFFRQGVDGILVADNGSTDGTSTILHRLAKEYPLFIATDRETGYFQAQKMDRLASFARAAGAGWIIPFDADEYWFGLAGSLRQTLLTTGAQIARAKIFNVFPIDVPGNTKPVWHVDLSPSHLEKVAFRPHRLAKLVHGNHAVIRPGRTEICLRVAHFPWRSFDHFKAKVRSRAPAYVATGKLGHGSEAVFGKGQIKSQAGSHWRYLAGLDDEELASEWRAVIDGRDRSRVAWFRRGVVIEADPRRWETWSLNDLPTATGQ